MNTAETCDVLVVGGGPAGSTCARQLVRAGFDVLVMDRKPFPRDKVCAGWITPAVVASLELDLGEYANGRVLQSIHGFRIGTIGGAEVRTRYDRPVSYGIRRCEFDHYLLCRSEARFLLDEPLKSMAREGEGWLVNGRIRASLVIGAGGHFCPVARLLQAGNAAGDAAEQAIVVAQEAEFPVAERERRECGIEQDVAQIYFCPDLRGYGWCFAKGGYLNVGLGREDSHRLSEHVAQFRDWLGACGGLPARLAARFNGHAYVLYPESRRRQYDDGVLLIGDAAGLAYPRSGEGIRPAVESALMAAETVREAAGAYAAARLAPYSERLARRFGRRNPGAQAAGWLPARLKQDLAARLLASAWFARSFVVQRWFLHAGQPALIPTL